MFPLKRKRLFLRSYFTLYYFQELIDEYKIYYDRNRFRRIHEHLPKYCLTQYRQLYPDDYSVLRKADFPLQLNPNPKHLRYMKYYLLVYLIRCLAICFVKPAANTRQKRILLGTEMFKGDSFYLEMSFLFWSSISYLYLQF